MTEQIINSDGSRNWQANILLDNVKRLEQELQRYKDMEAKGLEEFKDVGGCWGCGLQLQLDQDIKDINELKQENKELKETIKQYCEWLDDERESNDKLQKVYQNDHCDLLNYRSALKEIREIVKQANKDICDNCGWHNKDGCSPNGYLCHDLIEIKNKIDEVLQ